MMFEGAIRLFRDGGPVMYPLLLCSLVALTVVFERFIFHLRRWHSRDRKGLLEVLELVRKGRIEEARAKAEGSGDALLGALKHCLGKRTGEQRGVLEVVHAEEDRRLNRYLTVLDTIITLAPLLGILGTVLGIIDSFDLLGERGARDPMAVTGGIARALITTATGLVIAIVTLIPYNYLRTRSDAALSEIEEVASFLESYGIEEGRHPEGS